MEEVILVDEAGREIGSAEKLAAHRDGGRLHRAFSIVLFSPRGEMLLQRRATRKYHFGGLWTNACCGHPRPGEPLEKAARRRLREELGVDAELREVFSFVYSAEDEGSGLSEREFDHVLVGELDGAAQPDPEEIDALRWIDCAELERDLAERPECYTPWFSRLVERLPELRAAHTPTR
jgi:isopentenyl-diphosphate delta-isomerase